MMEFQYHMLPIYSAINSFHLHIILPQLELKSSNGTGQPPGIPHQKVW